MMIVGHLRTGDTFVEVDSEQWEKMSAKERKGQKRVKVLGLMPECSQDDTKVHLRTSAGTWCAPYVAPATIVGAQTDAQADAQVTDTEAVA